MFASRFVLGCVVNRYAKWCRHVVIFPCAFVVTVLCVGAAVWPSGVQKNIVSLNTMVLQYSPIDTVVTPCTRLAVPLSRVCPYMMASAVNVFGFLCWPSGFSSPIFEFYALNQSTSVVPLNETDTYLGDWIGTAQSVARVTRATTCVLFSVDPL